MPEPELDALICAHRDRLASTSEIDDVVDHVQARLAKYTPQLLEQRRRAGRLADGIAGLSRDDLGVITAVLDHVGNAEAAKQLGLTEFSYVARRARVLRALELHNASLGRRAQPDTSILDDVDARWLET